MQSLRKKVAVVTGAASGIGSGLAARFAAEGMNLVLADIDERTLFARANELAIAHPVEVLAVRTDVTDSAGVDALAARALDRFGTVHVVCNNVGVLGGFGMAWEAPLDEWRWQFDVNVWGVVHGIRAFVPILLAQDEGHIVNTASAASWVTAPGLAPYAATKHAVLAITEALRLELQACRSQVGVSVLCPQFVKTSILPPLDHADTDATVHGTAPTRRVQHALRKGIDHGVAPSVVAAAVIDGIRENRFLISEDTAAIVSNARRRLSIADGSAPGSSGVDGFRE